MARTSRKTAVALAAFIGLSITPASAMTIREFNKFTTEEQGTFIGAAVSMLAYTYAANGDRAKGRCIQHWYFGEPGKPTPGPEAIRTRLAAYESLDPDKYHVEGVILGVTDKVCGAGTPTAKSKQ